MARLLHILLYCSLCSTAAFAQTRDSIIKKQRLTTCVFKSYKYHDTVHEIITLQYKYSGNRGSTFRPLEQYRTIGFDYERFFYRQPELPNAHLPEPYRDAYKIQVAYDTVYDTQYDFGIDTSYLVRYKRYEDGFLISQTEDNGNGNYFECMFERNVAGLTTRIKETSYNGTSQNTQNAAVLVYDKDGYIQSDTLYQPNAKREVRTYEHDDLGRIRSIRTLAESAPAVWKYTLWNEYSYDTKGRLSQTTNWYMDNSQWITQAIQTLTYDSLDRLITFMNGPYNTTIYTYHYNQNGDMDTIIRDWSGQKYSIAYKYNEYHNPVMMYASELDSSGNLMSLYNTQEFSYEFYYDTIQVAAPVNTLPTILYPNPAGNTITVRWNKNKPAGPVHIYLYTSLGQSVRHYFIPTPKAEDSIDLSGLSSGAYHIQILSSGGGSIYNGNICINSQ